jgi:hypothetical protein
LTYNLYKAGKIKLKKIIFALKKYYFSLNSNTIKITTKAA